MTPKKMIRKPIIWAGLLFMALLLMPCASLLAETTSPAYRDVPWFGSRNFIWVIAQVHLLFGGFVLGVPLFAWVCELIGVRTGDIRYDNLAKEFTKLTVACFEMTATLGIILLFSLRVLYPRLWGYLTGVFLPTYYLYLLLFVGAAISLYLYWSKWDTMQNRKGLHLFTGFLLNLIGFFIMIVPNSWATFQASPVVMSESLPYFERVWAAINNPTWWPVNIHRLIANVVLGGFICGAYAGIRYLGAKTQEEREHYDWMGYIGNFIGIFGLLPLPFAGYWLMREIYQYNQQMGITLMGGFLSWLFILQAMLIGILFLGANYYFWQGLIHRLDGGVQYRKQIVTMLTILILCLVVWMTPHSLMASLQEARLMGGTHHPLLGVFGVMSAKMTVVNIVILVTFMSFLTYWRAGKQATVTWAKGAVIGVNVMFFLAAIAVIGLGVWGYFVPAIVRINYFSTTQVGIVILVLLTATPLMGAVIKSAKTTKEMKWGVMPAKSQYALILNATVVILTMTLMGYARSGSRQYWHIFGVMRDTSPYAYLPALGMAGAMMALNTFIVCMMLAFIFWVTSTVRYKGFSTQYFFIASFALWLVSLPEKLGMPTAQVSERTGYFRKVLAVVFGFLIIFVYVANQTPQQASLPPEVLKFDPAQIKTKEDLAKIGQKIFYDKGQCALCHSIGHSATARCPNLEGVGGKLTREFIYESVTQPQAYTYMDYTYSPPKFFPARMPVINKPPIDLNNNELLSVMAFIQSQGGEVTIDPSEIIVGDSGRGPGPDR
jgi:cytochrome bd-type quinol oxidase subunit 1